MKLYIRQKVFSWTDRFTVADETGNVRYTVNGELLSIGKKLHIYDASGREAALIRQRLLAFLPSYLVFSGGRQIAEVTRRFTFLSQRYTVSGPGWDVEGDMLAHEYEITRGSVPVVSISKAWFTWGDSYELDIADPADEINALAVVLAIDCATEQAASGS